MKPYIAVVCMLLAGPLFAQGKDSMGSDPEGKKSAEEFKLRVKFDEETAKGEITCGKGAVKGDSVEYGECKKRNIKEYEKIAVEKKIVAAEKLQGMEEKKKALAAKLAFLDSAKGKLKKSIDELKDKKDTMDYKKSMGAYKKISKELDKSIDECQKDKSGDFACPDKASADSK